MRPEKKKTETRVANADRTSFTRAVAELFTLRSILERGYPSLPLSSKLAKSTGQCAVSALIVQGQLGGQLVSTWVRGESHWFNRVALGDVLFDVDLTGDQFGLPAVQFQRSQALYAPSRRRLLREVAPETFARAVTLARRCGLTHAALTLLFAARSIGLERLLQAKDDEDAGQEAENDDARHEPRGPAFL